MGKGVRGGGICDSEMELESSGYVFCGKVIPFESPFRILKLSCVVLHLT